MNKNENSIYLKAKMGEMLDDLGIIDFHSHVGPFNNFYCPDSTASAMIRAMDRIGISKVCVNSMQAISSDFHAGNMETLAAMEEFPDRIIGFVVINPWYPDNIAEELDFFCTRKGMKGIKIHPGFHSCPVTDPAYIPVWEYAQKYKLPVLVHTWDDPKCHPQMFDSLAESYPDVYFILGHSGMPDFCAAVKAAERHNNIYLELTAAAFCNGVIEYFVGQLGAGKIIYGSDMGGWFSPLHGVGPVLYSKIPDSDKKKILSENAKHLLGIQDAS